MTDAQQQPWNAAEQAATRTQILNEELRQARERVQLGTTYKHKKGGIYRVTGHAVDTDTGKVRVRYRRVAGPDFDKFREADIEFVRSIDEFTPDRFAEIAG